MWEKTKGFLAVTAQDARAGEGLGVPCVCLYYRIGEKGTLQRAQLPLSGRGGLLGIYDGGGLAAAQPERLARDLQSECARWGFGGVVLDFSPPEEGLSRLEALCGALSRMQVRYFLSEGLAAWGGEDAPVIVPAAVSGGSFAQVLEALCSRWGAQRLCVDLVRACSDFPMPTYDPDGTALSPEAFRRLQETYQPQSFFSDRLCCKYFTYRRQNGSAHFVLFDDAQTAARKLSLICEAGIGHVFLLYSEWGREAGELLAGQPPRR